ncbi:MAG: hypothetical protein IPK78_18135 [Rhodospirillales bacterium]|nr:hypothetical protein [Rhodospirillales bacterium]
MANGRQIELRSGTTALALNDATYILQADGGWASEDERLAFKLLVKATALTHLERLITPIERMLTAATLYDQAMIGSPVYVVTKTCDDVATTAEVGATWLRKRVRGGQVRVVSLTGTAAAPQAYLLVELEVDGLWQRIAPASMWEATTGASVITATASGGLATAGAVELYARRMSWTSAGTGFTTRHFWTYGSGSSGSPQVHFMRLSGNFRFYYGIAATRFYFSDETGTVLITSAPVALTVGTTYEIVFRATTSGASIWLNGTSIGSYSSTVSWPSDPDTYRILTTDATSGNQTFGSVQLWATALADAAIQGMPARGMPEGEMCYLAPPTDEKMTNALYGLYNVPGHAPARLRTILASSGGQDFSKVLVAARPLRTPTAARWECESGTLGAATASNANASASSGSQARFTPADTSWATRVTVTLAANPTDVAALQGNHRLFLAAYDSAAAVNVNLVRWRLLVAGQAGAWSDELGLAAVATRSLLELGELSIPPDGWPEETLAATTTGYGSAYVTLELQASNTVGSGGGTLDLDALYLAPAEIEGVATATFDVSAVNLALDFATEPPVALTIYNPRSLEYAGPGLWEGNDLELAPAAGAAGCLWLAWFRDAAEQLLPNDTCDVRLYLAPRWRSS